MHEGNTQRIQGAWKLTAAKMVIEGDGERQEMEMWKDGRLLHDASGTMAVLLTGAGRVADDTEAGKAALYQTMLAYSGKVTVEADRLVTQVEVASAPAWVGTAQTRFYKFTEEGLSLWTETMAHPGFGGKSVTGYLDWVRAD